MRRALTLTSMLLAATAPAAGATQRPTPCGRVMIDGGWFAVNVERGTVRCDTARDLVRRYLIAPRSRCQGSHCLMRIRGWDCLAGGWDEPWTAECTRDGRLVRGYQADA